MVLRYYSLFGRCPSSFPSPSSDPPTLHSSRLPPSRILHLGRREARALPKLPVETLWSPVRPTCDSLLVTILPSAVQDRLLVRPDHRIEIYRASRLQEEVQRRSALPAASPQALLFPSAASIYAEADLLLRLRRHRRRRRHLEDGRWRSLGRAGGWVPQRVSWARLALPSGRERYYGRPEECVNVRYRFQARSNLAWTKDEVNASGLAERIDSSSALLGP